MKRVALICGGSGRIGAYTARVLAGEGYFALVHYQKSKEKAERIVEEIRSTGGLARAVQADLSDEKDVARLIEEIKRQDGRLDVLVNAVHAQFTPVPVAEMSWEDWTEHLNALKSHFLVCRMCLSLMRAQHYGRIIYISGGLARRFFAGCSAYSTIKAGLNAFSKTLAVEEGKNGITVNIVAPGKVDMDDDRPSTDNPQDWELANRASMANSPLGRHANLADVAAAVVYFASEVAGGVTGQTIYTAGGEIMP